MLDAGWPALCNILHHLWSSLLFSIRSVHCTVACDNTVDGQIPALQLVWYWYGEYTNIYIYTYISYIISHYISLIHSNWCKMSFMKRSSTTSYSDLWTGRSGPTTPDRGCGPQNGSWLAGKEKWVIRKIRYTNHYRVVPRLRPVVFHCLSIFESVSSGSSCCFACLHFPKVGHSQSVKVVCNLKHGQWKLNPTKKQSIKHASFAFAIDEIEFWTFLTQCTNSRVFSHFQFRRHPRSMSFAALPRHRSSPRRES